MSDNVQPIRPRRKDHLAPQTTVTPIVEWAAPLPLTGNEIPPAFPVDRYPDTFRRYVTGTAEAWGTEPDLLAAFVLAVLATVIAGRWNVNLDGWIEPLPLHVIAVAPPGSMKSPALQAAQRPLMQLERDLKTKHGPAVAQAEAERAELEQQLKRLDKKLGQDGPAGGDSTTAQASTADTQAAWRTERVDLTMQLAALPAPTVPRVFTTDSTVEQLEALLAANGGVMAWLDAEGGLFRTAAGRYGGRASLDVFTKGHAGDPIRVDRVGREPVTIDRPALTLGVGIQPDVFRQAARNLDLAGPGLFARQCITWAAHLPPTDRSKQRAEPNDAAAANYDAAIVRLFTAGTERALDGATVITLTVDPDANDALRAKFGENHHGQLDDGKLRPIAEWAAKLDGLTLRLAAVMALAENPNAVSVDLLAATRAIAIADYYTDHALKAFGEVGMIDDLRLAAVALKAIKRGPGSTTPADRWKDWPQIITTRDVHRATQNTVGLETADDVTAALNTLVDLDYLAPMERDGKRQPWQVNPGTWPDGYPGGSRA